MSQQPTTPSPTQIKGLLPSRDNTNPTYNPGYNISPNLNNLRPSFFLQRRISQTGGNIFSLMRNNIRQSYKPDVFSNTNVYSGRVIAVIDPRRPEFCDMEGNVFSTVYSFYRKALINPEQMLPVLMKVSVPGVTDMLAIPDVNKVTNEYLTKGLIRSRADVLADNFPTFVAVNNDLNVFPGDWVTVEFANMYKMFNNSPSAAGRCVGVIGDVGVGGICDEGNVLGSVAPPGAGQQGNTVTANTREGASLNRSNDMNVALIGSAVWGGTGTTAGKAGDDVETMFKSKGYKFYTENSEHQFGNKIIVPDASIENYIDNFAKVVLPDKAHGVVIQFQEVLKAAAGALTKAEAKATAENKIRELLSKIEARLGTVKVAFVGTYKAGMHDNLKNADLNSVFGDIAATNPDIEFFNPKKYSANSGKMATEIKAFVGTTPKTPPPQTLAEIAAAEEAKRIAEEAAKKKGAVTPGGATPGVPPPSTPGLMSTPAPVPPTQSVVLTPAQERAAEHLERTLARFDDIWQDLEVGGHGKPGANQTVTPKMKSEEMLKQYAAALGWSTNPKTTATDKNWEDLITRNLEQEPFTEEQYVAIIASLLTISKPEAEAIIAARDSDKLVKKINELNADASAIYQGLEAPSRTKANAESATVGANPADPCINTNLGASTNFPADAGYYPPTSKVRKHSHAGGPVLPYVRPPSQALPMVHLNTNDFAWAGGIENPQRHLPKAAKFLGYKNAGKSKTGKQLYTKASDKVGTGPMTKDQHKAFDIVKIKWFGEEGRTIKVGRRAVAAYTLVYYDVMTNSRYAPLRNYKTRAGGGSFYQWVHYPTLAGPEKPEVDGRWGPKKRYLGDIKGALATTGTGKGRHGLSHHVGLATDQRSGTNGMTTRRLKESPVGTKSKRNANVTDWKGYVSKEFPSGIDIATVDSLRDPDGNKVELQMIDMMGLLIEVFKKYGFRWGGDYGGHRAGAQTDAMHFEFFGDPRVAAQLANTTGVPDIVVS